MRVSSFFLIPSSLSCSFVCDAGQLLLLDPFKSFLLFPLYFILLGSLFSLSESCKVLFYHSYAMNVLKVYFFGNYSSFKILLAFNQFLNLQNVIAEVVVCDVRFPGGHPVLDGIRLLGPDQIVQMLVVDLLSQ